MDNKPSQSENSIIMFDEKHLSRQRFSKHKGYLKLEKK